MSSVLRTNLGNLRCCILTAMETVLAAVIGASGAAVIAGLLQFIYVARVKSGAIKTTEAEQLWKESAAIRVEQLAEIAAYKAGNEQMRRDFEEKLTKCREDSQKQREETYGLREQIIGELREKEILQVRIEKTEWRVAALSEEIALLKGGQN